MPKIFPSLPPVLLGLLAVHCLSMPAQTPKPAKQSLFPGFSATAADRDFPGISATAADGVLPGAVPSPIGPTPLASPPTVIEVAHFEPGQMSDADIRLVLDRQPDLHREAARSNFDLASSGWQYRQIACAPFPDFVLLAFTHGAEADGSSRFVAILPRSSSPVRIVAAYAHGLLPFTASWNRPGSFAIFNSILRDQRGRTPIGDAPDWLLIGMCYAELSGYPVQVLSTLPNPEPTLDMLRLEGNRPQLTINPNQSADVTFSDVSQPSRTTGWSLHFSREGEITSATRGGVRQPAAIALKP